MSETETSYSIAQDIASAIKANSAKLLKILAILVAALVAALLPLPDHTLASRMTLAIFVLAAGLWVTEAIPPFATSIIVIVLQVYLLGKPEGPLQLKTQGILESYRIFINPIASPVIVLFFGGFILARAVSQCKLDRYLAHVLLRPFGSKPSSLLMGAILITGFLSMFMSNTATTAMMIAILAPLGKQLADQDPFRKALILSVPLAANVGGMGTVIGTPPNAVAVSVLGAQGYTINFLQWMIVAFPLAVLMMFIVGFVLKKLFPAQQAAIVLPEVDASLEIRWPMLVVAATALITVFLWITEPFHHIPSAVVAMIPVMVFPLFGIMGVNDLKKIEWDVLILIAGGLSLGVAMNASGLAALLMSYLPLENLPIWLILLVIAIVTIALSNFMSNTAAANILIPMVTSITLFSPLMSAVFVALCASLAMSLPISTPPNAIAFSTRAIRTQDLAIAGTLISLIGSGSVVILALLLY